MTTRSAPGRSIRISLMSDAIVPDVGAQGGTLEHRVVANLYAVLSREWHVEDRSGGVPMRVLVSQVEIGSLPERVWDVLTDFVTYPDWNPFIRRASGELREGARLEVVIQPPGRRATTFRPVVVKLEAGRELRWLGRLVLPKLFDGEHIHQLEPLGEDRTRYVQSERFSGALVGLFRRQLDDTLRSFEAMNEALKVRAESTTWRLSSSFSWGEVVPLGPG